MSLVDKEWPRGGEDIQQDLHNMQSTLLEWNRTTFGNIYKWKQKS